MKERGRKIKIYAEDIIDIYVDENIADIHYFV